MSSLGGFCSAGNRSRSARTVSIVSSTDSVVCESHTTFSGSRTCTLATSSGPSTSWMWVGASPAVPSTSSWPRWPISRMSKSSRANRFASWCTLVTSGQVASIVRSCRVAASSCTAGETPWALNTTTEPSGTSSVSSTKIAPRRSSVATTCLLWTICLRTYTGAPWISSARSTAITARSTPAQYPRGSARSTRPRCSAMHPSYAGRLRRPRSRKWRWPPPLRVEMDTEGVARIVVGQGERMSREIPEFVRAAAGLAATVLDEARKLPETLPGLPVRLIGLAMQQAMKVQQQYAGLVARGDELFTGLRGENEPGLATFDDDEPAPASNGFRESAFDRAGGPSTVDDTLTDAEVESLPADPAADAVTSVVDELADQVETGQQSIEEIAEEAPAIEEILDEIAIDELIDQAPTLEETAPTLSLVTDAPATEDADALETALLESDDSPAATDDAVEAEPTADVSTSVDVLTPEGEVATVDAAITDEGIAAPEAPEADAPAADDDTVATTDAGTEGATETPDTAATDTDAGPATATDESGSDVAAATGVRTDVGGS